MLNKKMNEALEVISAMAFEEKMLYMSIAFDEAVMDKDYLAEGDKETDEVPYVINYNTFQRPKKYDPKFIRKDKAKAGYHNGSKKGGYGDWDKWGKSEKVTKDLTKDFQAQLIELNLQEGDFSIKEAVMLLMKMYQWKFKNFSMDKVFFHPYEWYDSIHSNVEYVNSLFNKEVEKLEALQKSLFNTVEDLFPEMGMGFQNEVVTEYNAQVMVSLENMKDQMILYLVNMFKDNRMSELLQAEWQYHQERNRLEALMEKADRYIK